MGFLLDANDYVQYIKNVYRVLGENKDYITDLDLATGDGDHFANIHMGFEKMVEKADALATLSMADLLKEIGKIMMSVIGGSSGVLYGSAYLGAAKTVTSSEISGLDAASLCAVLDSMLAAIMSRGNAAPGQKTMIDSLYPAVEEYKKCLVEGESEEALCERVIQAAKEGAESTKHMEAMRGRATYQANKGVGHLDPGAVTMAYQLEELMKTARGKIHAA